MINYAILWVLITITAAGSITILIVSIRERSVLGIICSVLAVALVALLVFAALTYALEVEL